MCRLSSTKASCRVGKYNVIVNVTGRRVCLSAPGNKCHSAWTAHSCCSGSGSSSLLFARSGNGPDQQVLRNVGEAQSLLP